MVAQLREPVQTLPWLMTPDVPPAEMIARVGGRQGFTRATDGTFTVSAVGHHIGPIAQRIVLSYALRFQTREQLAERWTLSVRHVGSVIAGDAHHWFTAPVRRWLISQGIGDERMQRDALHGRLEQVNAALTRIAAEASVMLRPPVPLSQTAQARVTLDLYLISGAWLNEDAP